MFHVILGDAYVTYDGATNILGLEKLSDRRLKLCLSFARKCETHPKYANWFHAAEEVLPPSMNTRSDKVSLQTKYKPVPCRTDRYKNSPIPFLTELLNMDSSRKK